MEKSVSRIALAEEDMAMFLLMFPARLNLIQNNSCTEVVCSYVRFGIYLRTKNINRKRYNKASVEPLLSGQPSFGGQRAKVPIKGVSYTL